MRVVCAHGVVLDHARVYVKDGEWWRWVPEVGSAAPVSPSLSARLTKALDKYNQKATA